MKRKLISIVSIVLVLSTLLSACGSAEKVEITKVECSGLSCMITLENTGKPVDFKLLSGLEYPGVPVAPIMSQYYDTYTGEKRVEQFVRSFDNIGGASGKLPTGETLVRVNLPWKVVTFVGQTLMQMEVTVKGQKMYFYRILVAEEMSRPALEMTCKRDRVIVTKIKEYPQGIEGAHNFAIYLDDETKYREDGTFHLSLGETYTYFPKESVKLVDVDFDGLREDRWEMKDYHGVVRQYCTPGFDQILIKTPVIKYGAPINGR